MPVLGGPGVNALTVNESMPNLAHLGLVGDGSTDNTAAWNAAITTLAASGARGAHFLPRGVYNFATAPSAIPGGMTIVGAGYDYAGGASAGNDTSPSKGTVLRATATMTNLVTLGSVSTYGSGDTGAKIRDLVVDGHGLAGNAVHTVAPRSRIEGCQVYRGATNGVMVDGQNTWIVGGVVNQMDVGTCINIAAHDVKVIDGEQRQAGNSGAEIWVGAPACMIRGNHMYSTVGAGNPTPRGHINIDASGGNLSLIMIEGNTIEVGNCDSIHVSIGNGNTVSFLKVIGNEFYNTSTTDNTYAVLGVAIGSGTGTLDGLVMVGNTMSGGSATNRITGLISQTTGNTLTMKSSRLIGNHGDNVVTVVGGTLTPPGEAGLLLYGNTIQTGTARFYDSASGSATLSGTGAATSFTIAHGMGTTPIRAIVSPRSAAAVGAYVSAIDSTNITVSFATAPTSGTNNVLIDWIARRY